MMARVNTMYSYGGALLAFLSYQMLLSTVPEYIGNSQRDFGRSAITNGILLSAVVGGQLIAPTLVRRLGAYQTWGLSCAVGIIGTVAIAAEAARPGSKIPIGLLSAAQSMRGLGFGAITVVGTALAVVERPLTERGRGLASYGVVVALPTVLGVPFGLYVMHAFDMGAVCLTAGALLGGSWASMHRVVGVQAPAREVKSKGLTVYRLSSSGAIQHVVFFTLVCSVFYSVVPLLPLILRSRGIGDSGVFVAVVFGCQALGRWLAGLAADYGGSQHLGLPSVLAVIGLLGVSTNMEPKIFVIGIVVYGLAVGWIFTMVYLRMLGLSGARVYVSSAAWNMSIDAGGAGGSFALGLMAGVLGLARAVSLAVVPMMLAVVLSLLGPLRRTTA